MDIEIVGDRKNDLLSRREIEFVVKHSGAPTPSLEEVRSALSAKLSIKPETLIVKNYKTLTGAPSTRGRANVYPSKDAIIEPKHLIKRNIKEEPKKEEPAKEEANEGDAKEGSESA